MTNQQVLPDRIKLDNGGNALSLPQNIYTFSRTNKNELSSYTIFYRNQK